MATVIESDPLVHIPLFAKLSAEERAELALLFQPRRFEAAKPIVFLGEPGKEFFIIEQGKVAISVLDENGREVRLALLGPGHFFGEISLLDGGPRTATARAETDATLLELGREDFLKFIGGHPAVAIHMMTILGQRQRETNEKLRGIKNVNQIIDETRTTGERIAARLAMTFASNRFVIFNLIFFAFWIVTNVLLMRQHQNFDDPPTFSTLGFMITLESILLSMFVLASQKFQSDRDRIRSDLEYQVNVKAHLEVLQLHQKVDRLEAMLQTASDAE